MVKTILSCLLFAFSILSAFSQFPPNQNISNGIVFDGEPFLAMNPTDHNNLVAAWMSFQLNKRIVIRSRVSFDGGVSWSNPQYFNHHDPSWTNADVTMDFDSLGNLYLASVDYDKVTDTGGIWVQRSTDGGLTWNEQGQAFGSGESGELPLDRPWLVAGRNAGELFLTSTSANWNPLPNRPFYKRSTDGGLTWSSLRMMDTTGYLCGNLIAVPMATPGVSANNTWHSIYASYLPSQNLYPQYIQARSTDSGLTWNYNSVLAGNNGTGDTLHKSGYKIAQHPTDPSKIAFSWVNYVNGDADIYLTHSENGGNTWSSMVRVNDDAIANGKSQDLVWMTYSNNGKLVAAWRDRRNAPGSGYEQPSDIYCAYSNDNGATFSASFRLNSATAAHDSILNGSGNDFMCITAFEDTVFAVWGDVRSATLNIYFTKTAVNLPTSSQSYLLSREELPIIRTFPNPGSDNIQLIFPEVAGKGSILEVTDISGKLIAREIIENPVQEFKMEISSLASGKYSVKLNSNNEVRMGSFIRK